MTRGLWHRLPVALVALGMAAGCGGARIAVMPLPVETVAPTTTATGPAPTSAAPSTTTAGRPPPRPPRSRPGTPTPTPTPTPTRDASCLDPVRYELKLAETENLPETMCFTAGGILRLQGIEPGLVTVDPESLASSSYEAGGVDIVFLRPGTVEVTVPRADRVDTITVVVIR